MFRTHSPVVERMTTEAKGLVMCPQPTPRVLLATTKGIQTLCRQDKYNFKPQPTPVVSTLYGHPDFVTVVAISPPTSNAATTKNRYDRLAPYKTPPVKVVSKRGASRSGVVEVNLKRGNLGGLGSTAAHLLEQSNDVLRRQAHDNGPDSPRRILPRSHVSRGAPVRQNTLWVVT